MTGEITGDVTDSEKLMVAIARLRAAREHLDALAPMRRLLADAEEDLRAAAVAAAEAGLSERTIAAQAETSQPTVNRLLDARRAEPLPPPVPGEKMWIYHRIATTLQTLTRRLTAGRMPAEAPSQRHRSPAIAVDNAVIALGTAADQLADAAAATEYGYLLMGHRRRGGAPREHQGRPERCADTEQRGDSTLLNEPAQRSDSERDGHAERRGEPQQRSDSAPRGQSKRRSESAQRGEPEPHSQKAPHSQAEPRSQTGALAQPQVAEPA